jgi:hypothetical protein
MADGADGAGRSAPLPRLLQNIAIGKLGARVNMGKSAEQTLKGVVSRARRG